MAYIKINEINIYYIEKELYSTHLVLNDIETILNPPSYYGNSSSDKKSSSDENYYYNYDSDVI